MNLRLHRYATPADFLTRAESFLAAAEAENVLMLGLCRPGGWPRFDESCYLAVVADAEEVVACALRTPPHSALLTRAERPALELLASDLLETYPDLPAVAGPEPTIDVFAELWSARAAAPVRLAVGMRVLEALQILQPPLPPGRFRPALEADLPTVARWTEAFLGEVDLAGSSDPNDVAREGIAKGRLFVWEDEQPVSLAAWTGPTASTVRINAVYTPPEHRRHGYASACVAALSQRLLDQGFSSCCLYADRANATSNKIYQAIGYRPVCESAEYRVETSTHRSE